MEKPELLAPCGDLECLKAAIQNGADSVYLGTSGFNARARATNFDYSTLAEAIKYAKLRNVRVHVTLNILIKNEEFEDAVKLALDVYNLGADALIMPCNTAHYFAKDIDRAVYIPLIHIVKCSAEAIKKKYPYVRKIGLIATTGTIKAGVYGDILKNYDLETITLNEELENNIMDCIYKGVKAGKTEEYSKLFQKCVDDIASLGAELLIAGCTEIPLLMPYIKTNLPVIDATYELASAAVKYALNK